MSTAIDARKIISIAGETEPRAIGSGFRSPVRLVFTSFNRTLKALEKAIPLAIPFNREIEILVMQTVPFVLPLDDPSVPLEFLVRRLEEMASGIPQKIRISAYLCRDRLEGLKRVLNRNCPVVIGVRKRWWPTSDERVALKLRRSGYDVITVAAE